MIFRHKGPQECMAAKLLVFFPLPDTRCFVVK